MQNIASGHLRVLTFARIYSFPQNVNVNDNEISTRKAELRVANDVFWVRLCAMGDLGFAEAYMYGDVECDDLVSLFHVSPLLVSLASTRFTEHHLTDISRQS